MRVSGEIKPLWVEIFSLTHRLAAVIDDNYRFLMGELHGVADDAPFFCQGRQKRLLIILSPIQATAIVSGSSNGVTYVKKWILDKF